MRTLFTNPMLTKEIRVRFRSLKTFIGLFLFLAVLHGATAVAIYLVSSVNYGSTGFITADTSRSIYWGLVVIQVALVLMITPGLTAGTISAEREKQTLNVLLTTTQSSLSIIYSKVISSVLFFMLLMIAALPTYSIVFLYGGISIERFVMVMCLLLMTVLFVASYSTLISSFFRRSTVSVIVAYAVTVTLNALFYVGLFLIGSDIGTALKGEMREWTVVFLKSGSIITLLETYLSRDQLVYGIDMSRLTNAPFYYLAMVAVSSLSCILLAAWRLRPSLRARK